ncbi:sensor histidine kinase [Caminibacter profundus]
MRFNSLKTKILFWFISIFTFFLLIFSFAFYYYFNKDIENKIQNKLYKTAIQIKEKLQNNIPVTNQNVLILKNNQVIYKGKNFLIDYKILNSNQNFSINDLGENLQATFILNFDNTKIIISKLFDDKSENVVDSMLVLEPILLILLIFASSKLIDKIIDPIKKITAISNNISMNNFNEMIPNIYKENELKALINSYNKMIKRLQEEFKNLERFNKDVSHELKTPLTRIKGEIETTLKQQRDINEYIKTLKSINEETNEMQEIIKNLLLLTKYSKENISKTFTKCDLDEILLSSIEKFTLYLKEKNIKINIKRLENIEYFGNQNLLSHLFSNLIDNAIKYSNQNSTIAIKLYKKNKVYFYIKDEGIGIPKDKIKYITKQFFRVEESRNKSIKGFGLGLSIVENAVLLHNGNLLISSTPNKGTKVLVIL